MVGVPDNVIPPLKGYTQLHDDIVIGMKERMLSAIVAMTGKTPSGLALKADLQTYVIATCNAGVVLAQSTTPRLTDYRLAEGSDLDAIVGRLMRKSRPDEDMRDLIETLAAFGVRT